MIHLENDYSAGAHPDVLNALISTNIEGNTGYGLDKHTQQSAKIILRECNASTGNVFFLAGGTQTNAVALDWLCRPGEGVLATADSHINVHESGAIEAFGHKIIVLPSVHGKIKASDIENYMSEFYADSTWPHRVRPSMVYISQPTETGTLYSLSELEALHHICSKFELKLYADGARLIYALSSPYNDVTLTDLVSYTDMFYIGGTKAGTLFGEALVIPGEVEYNRFFAHVKRHGALLAKGWLTAVQFKALFTDNLYKRIGATAIHTASQINELMITAGCTPVYPVQTNQLFYEMPACIYNKLCNSIVIDVQKQLSKDSYLVRMVTDWSNSAEDVTTIESVLV
ncbi:MAG: beta-eliminating lyase-related protein [Ruminococcus sp.]|nr:beta-eliminating lyase-related protein [Ruminococcus sp.]